jgi:hypothetical protein
LATDSWAIRASTALFGLSIAIGIAPWLQLPARASDPVSALRVAGYSPAGLILQFALAVLLTAGFAILGERVARVLDGYRWAAVSYCAALLLAPVALMFWGNLRHVGLLGATAAAIVAVRKRDPRFDRGDVVLIPIALSCYMAFLDLGFGRTPLPAFLRALIAVFALRLVVRASDRMVGSSLALLTQLGWFHPVVPLIVIFGAPFLPLRLPRRIVYPIVVFIYPLTVLTLPPPTTANFFEDSHNVPVAAEMLRGEKPYTDIVPTHGLIFDGALDYAALRMGVRSLRTILEIRLVAGVLSAVAIYCVVGAATGSADAGLLGAFLAFSLFSGSTLWMRPAAALFALAAAVAATRLRFRRWFIAAGALVVAAFLVSVDFGTYSGLLTLFAAFRSRALKELAIGVAALLVPLLVLFAILGFAGDFVRVNVEEVFGGQSAGFDRLLTIPEGLRSPALMHTLPNTLEPALWVLAFITACVILARSPFRARRQDALALIGVWTVVAAAAYVRRGSFHFAPALAPFVAAGLWTLSRRARTVSLVLTAVVVLLAEPFRHALIVIPGLREPRTEGPLFDPTTTASIDAARRFAATLRPGETFVDFSNSALLYPLLGRDCPLRHIGVTSYQKEEAQREVIARIERNPRIRAALITFPGSNQNIDNVPNSTRAPLVWAYLQRNFTPAFEENGVVFWRRSK